MRASAAVPDGVGFNFLDRSGVKCRVSVLGDVKNPSACPSPQFSYSFIAFDGYPHCSFEYSEPRAVELFGR